MSKDIIKFVSVKSSNLIYFLFGIKYWKQFMSWLGSGNVEKDLVRSF